MKYSNIHFDRSPITPADVSAGPSFDQLLRSATPKAWYQTGWFYAVAGLATVAAVVTTAMLWPTSESEMGQEASAPTTTFAADSSAVAESVIRTIDAPFGDVIAWEEITVDADNGGTYRIGNSDVHVPAGAFQTLQGQTVNGKVQLRFRTFRDKADLFLSGIPMEYDSAGTTYTFESDGMFELEGLQNGKALQLHPERPLGVDFASNTDNPNFNAYAFNEDTGNWEYLGKPIPQKEVIERAQQTAPRELVEDSLFDDEMEVSSGRALAVLSSSEQEFTSGLSAYSVQSSTVESVPTAPIKPVAADPEKYQIKLEYDSLLFPELNAYAEVLFEIDDKDGEQAKSAREEAWNELNISRIADSERYMLTFSRPGEAFSVEAYPVFNDADLHKARAVFEEKYAEYQVAKAQAEVVREERRDYFEQRNQRYDMVARNAQIIKEERVLRAFTVRRFGVYNCDTPMPMPGNSVVSATAVNENGTPLVLGRLFLIEKERNAIWQMRAPNTINYSTAHTNWLWGLTMAGDLAICSPQTFQAVIDGTQEALTFEVQDLRGASEAELREALEAHVGSEKLNVYQ